MASAEPSGTSAFAAELRAQRTARGWTQVELGTGIARRGPRAPEARFPGSVRLRGQPWRCPARVPGGGC